MENSPFLERLLEKDFEVLYLIDPVDEYLMQSLPEYEDKKFQNASKDNLKLGKEGKDKKKEKAIKVWPQSFPGDRTPSCFVMRALAVRPAPILTQSTGRVVTHTLLLSVMFVHAYCCCNAKQTQFAKHTQFSQTTHIRACQPHA